MITETCEILVTTFNEGQVIAGKIILENGELHTTSQEKYKGLIKEIRKVSIQVRGKEIDPTKDPLKWIRGLPTAYNGSHLRARLVEK